jgi:hypothetical protein
VLSKRGQQFVQLLLDFCEQHGRPPGKGETFKGQPLGRQLFKVCRKHCLGKLGVAITAAIEAAMGPDWDWNRFEQPASESLQVREVLFNGYLLVLQSYVAQKRCMPGREDIWQGVQIGQWIRQQQRAHRRRQLLPQEVQLLEQVPGWTWPVIRVTAGTTGASSEAVFENRVALLRQFQAQHGAVLPDLSCRQFQGVNLLRWMMRMWSEHRKGSLAPHRVATLEAVPGWTWDTGSAGSSSSSSSSGGGAIKGVTGSKGTTPAIAVGGAPHFAMQLQRLQDFVAKHGHPPTSADGAAAESMGIYQWLCQVRAAHRRGQLSVGQVATLEAVPGWSWTPWEYTLVATRQFVVENGRLPGVVDEQWGKSIGRWCCRQQKAGRDGKLSKAQRQQLEALPGWKW